MTKVLGQSGVSLADSYDVEGSIAGVDELLTKDVNLVHEMGATMQSERLQSFIVLGTSGALNQSTAWAVAIGGFPDSINRILAITVIATESARVTAASVAIEDVPGTREIPIWTWDITNDLEVVCRWDLGAGVLQDTQLRPAGGVQLPSLVMRLGVSKDMPVLIFRGTTEAFGAGTVTVDAVALIARPNTGNPAAGEPSGHGLPLPSW